MKYALLLMIFAALTFIGCPDGSDNQAEADSAATEQATYTCPMHPSVLSDRPGACPVCGMSLVKVSGQTDLTVDEEQHLTRVSLSPSQRILANISTTAATQSDATRMAGLVGFVDVAEPLEVIVPARFRGRIERLYANVTGEHVRKGDPLFELYSPDLVTSVQEFVLALEASSSGSSQDPSLPEGIRSRLRLHYGMTDRQISEIEQTRTVSTTVTYFSPISGTILEKNLREGEYVNEGSVLYRVADLSRVWIMLEAYEQDIRHFTVGQTVVIGTDAYPGERFSGRITFIDPVMDPSTRTTRIRTEFSNAHGKLLPNMFVSAQVELRQSGALVVPRAAILQTGRRTLVWVETMENTFEPRDVTIGFRGDRLVEIISGLRSGEKVASTGGFLIDSESALQYGTPDSSQNPGYAMPAVGSDGVAVVDITVKGSYTPDVIRVRKDQPLRLRFFRNERSLCTKEVRFPELNMSRTLADFDTTEISITPTKTGTIHFSCGMDMVHGQLIVE